MAIADAASRVRFFDLLAAAADPAVELRAGLAAPLATIPPKFFYDALGARLFEAICELPEYTLPRDERVIFDRYTDEFARQIGAGCTLIDLGAGDCAKAERLFEALQPAQYVAVDIAGGVPANSARVGCAQASPAGHRRRRRRLLARTRAAARGQCSGGGSFSIPVLRSEISRRRKRGCF